MKERRLLALEVWEITSDEGTMQWGEVRTSLAPERLFIDTEKAAAALEAYLPMLRGGWVVGERIAPEGPTVTLNPAADEVKEDDGTVTREWRLPEAPARVTEPEPTWREKHGLE